MSKKKPLELTLTIPDEKILSHITNAYGLVCQYRTINKVPHESLENWLTRLAVEGCNAMYKFHDQNVAKIKKEQAEQAAAAEAPATEAADGQEG